MARKRNAVPTTKFLVSLEPPLAIELEAFCRAHFDAPRMTVIRRALETYLHDRIAADPIIASEYEKHLAELSVQPPFPRLVTDSESREG